MRFFGLFILLLVSFRLSAGNWQFGVKIGLNSGIGTGKGYWDWNGGASVRRLWEPSGAVSALVQWDSQKHWAMESGLIYADNRCGIEVDAIPYLYRQPSVEWPLSGKIYFSEGDNPFFVKAGASLIVLTGGAFFKNQSTQADLFQESRPGKLIHAGILGGFGMEFQRPQCRLVAEMQYSTFYSSPEYSLDSAGTGNIRFHRVELGLGILF